MPVYEGQQVRPGQLLFVLDQIQQRAEVNADAAEARKNRYNAERYIFLNQQGAVSTKERDFYVTQAIQSRDKLQASLATLSYKNVVAPIPGYVGNLNYKIGDVIQAGAVVSSVIDNSKLWEGGIREQRAAAHGVKPEELEDFYASRNLLNARVRSLDVARAAAFFLSDESSRTTGSVIAVDGGVAAAFAR
jgi:multidrug efflux pump subunit AcrA (membrane-fusion protein)